MYLFVEIFEISLKSLILPPGFKPKIWNSDRKCLQIPSVLFENIDIIMIQVSIYYFKTFGALQMYFLLANIDIPLKLQILPPDLGQKGLMTAVYSVEISKMGFNY